MLKLILPLAMLGLSACVSVPVAPYYGGGQAIQVQPDEYDLPAHCYYNSQGRQICG